MELKDIVTNSEKISALLRAILLTYNAQTTLH